MSAVGCGITDKDEIMKLKLFVIALLSAISFAAFGQVSQLQAFAPNANNTITITANTSGNIPTPVQAIGQGGNIVQYMLTNIGVNNAFISYSNTSAGATTNCVVPTGTATATVPLLATSQIIITLPASQYFCGITSSGTSIIYVTPGAGT